MKKFIIILLSLTLLSHPAFCQRHHHSRSGETVARVIGLVSGIAIGANVSQNPPPPAVIVVQTPSTVIFKPAHPPSPPPRPFVFRPLPLPPHLVYFRNPPPPRKHHSRRNPPRR